MKWVTLITPKLHKKTTYRTSIWAQKSKKGTFFFSVTAFIRYSNLSFVTHLSRVDPMLWKLLAFMGIYEFRDELVTIHNP